MSYLLMKDMSSERKLAEKINNTIHHSHVHEELCNLNEKAWEVERHKFAQNVLPIKHRCVLCLVMANT